MSVAEDFLTGIFIDMDYKYNIEREKWREELKKFGEEVYFVHELCECAEKRRMRERFPEIAKASIYNPRFVVGWLIEEAVRARIGNSEERRVYKIVEVGGKKVVIAGNIDIIKPENKKVIEVKYLTGLYGTPHEHHKLQLSLYLWLKNEEKGELLEISPEGVIGIEVESAKDEDVIELIKNPKIPMWPDFECRLCAYEPWCPYSTAREKRK
jgi:CRISPR-associated exonuclease Cas4